MDAGEVERLKSQKLKLEEAISTFEDNLRAVKSELKNIEDQGAKLEKQRVFSFFLLWLLFLEVVLYASMWKFTLGHLFIIHFFNFFFLGWGKGGRG